jgi:hypothetical protein
MKSFSYNVIYQSQFSSLRKPEDIAQLGETKSHSKEREEN